MADKKAKSEGKDVFDTAFEPLDERIARAAIMAPFALYAGRQAVKGVKAARYRPIAPEVAKSIGALAGGSLVVGHAIGERRKRNRKKQ